MPNTLTQHVGLKAGPWFLETLLKHYFERIFHDRGSKDGENHNTTNMDESGKLRRDELLYDEVFHIVKSFLDVSTHHTIEELQQFSNTRTPSSPWINVMRLRIPMPCCDDAARYLIDVLGGDEKTRQVVGGTKWWQVRGVRGIDAQWIVARKDYHRIKKQRKQQQQQAEQSRREISMNSDEDIVYDPQMDELPCILYFHGGGYYFGSVDQERFFIQRFARKSGCRLLATSYRLAPQYPFPCAIQDALASYLYLIHPPPDAPHSPVNPAHIMVAGDSAGGGLTLALLQVIRDSGLPLPAGGIPISPWCDLTHSFPSVHLNTDTDVMPKYGLSIYKPSVLWPPPSDELSNVVQAGIRSRIKEIARLHRGEVDENIGKEEESVKASRPSFWKRTFSFPGRNQPDKSVPRGRSSSRQDSTRDSLGDLAKTGDVRAAAVARSVSGRQSREGQVEDLRVGSAAPLPTADNTNAQTLRMETRNGEVLEIQDQVHMYAPNNLLIHPLVSPAMSYLGGLPPLLFIASDGEVLRDEIIYAAHKAAHPDRYPIKPEARKLYPKLEGIEDRYEPTKVHLQVYDHAAHTFPVLFFVCSSSKFCYRAMAIFSKYILGTLPAQPEVLPSSSSNELHRKVFRRSTSLNVTIPRRLSMIANRKRRSSLSEEQENQRHQSTERMLESAAQVTGSPGRTSPVSTRSSTSDRQNSSAVIGDGPRLAGDPIVYLHLPDGHSTPFIDNMIRERVSTRGEIRPLEAESELPGCTMPLDRIGIINELILRRYIEGSTKWNDRFAKAKEHIRKQRAQSLRIARNDAMRMIPRLQMYFFLNADTDEGGGDASLSGGSGEGGSLGVKEGLKRSAASWAWAWALDGDERPPPSSIVARRDTEEARRLARIADFPADMQDHRVSGNNLWSYLVHRLSLEKNEARVEQQSVETDLKGVGKDVSFDAPVANSQGKTRTEGERSAGDAAVEEDGASEAKKKKHKSKPLWRRSLSRFAKGGHHRDSEEKNRLKNAVNTEDSQTDLS